MAKYRVTWNEVYLCAREVEADSLDAAIDMVSNAEVFGESRADEREFGLHDHFDCF